MFPSAIVLPGLVGAVMTLPSFASMSPFRETAGRRPATVEIMGATYEWHTERDGGDAGWIRRDAGTTWDVHGDRCTIQLRRDASGSIADLLSSACGTAGAATITRINRLGFADVVLHDVDSVEICAMLASHPDVLSATPACRGRWMEGSDPYFSYQWHLKNTGQESQGTPGADIGIVGAWGYETGDSSVMIAFLDSPLRVDHPDLVDAFTPNTGEFPGNGIDDDGNGFADDIHGWNFGTDSPIVHSDDVDAFHGTRVAGIAVARAGNGVSVAGVAGGDAERAGCRAIQVVIGTEGPESSCIDDAILYAIDRGARVLSLTFGVPADPSLLAAIEEAATRGVVMVAPAGNLLPEVPFPANHPLVMAVGGTNRDDAHWGISTAGPPVEIAAPAYMIRTTDPAWPLWTVSGTSYAVPQVAAAAALVLSWADCLDGAAVRGILRETARDIDVPGWDPRTGWGRLDVAAAVGRVATAVMPACRCREDFDGDGEVDGTDLGLLLTAWGGSDALTDLHVDGVVDAIDLGLWLTAQGRCR